MQNGERNIQIGKIKIRTYTELHRGFTELHRVNFFSVVLCVSPCTTVIVLKRILVQNLLKIIFMR